MSNAEHLLENTIFAMKRNEDVNKILDQWPNKDMLEASSFKKDDFIRMAAHVVYSLYDGLYPGEVTSLNSMTEPWEDN